MFAIESDRLRPAADTGEHMCHWVFDEGLLAVSGSYEVVASKMLNVPDNLPGYLTSLEGRAIFRPSLEGYWPDPESLQWHKENVLR